MTSATVVIHPSQFPDALRSELLASLRKQEINHKFHYDTPKQAQKWLALHSAYSPARNDSACLETYDCAFRSAALAIKSAHLSVIGLGCGGGQKDAQLLQLLFRRGRSLEYVACDVSVSLALVARSVVGSIIPEKRIYPLVCDLATVENFEDLLPKQGRGERLVTFFGMIPNFEPKLILPRLAAIVRTGDWLLFSANLVPDMTDAAMRRIQPQYDNDLTRDWLTTLLFDLGVKRGDGAANFAIERTPGPVPLRRFVARFRFRRKRTIRIGNDTVEFKAGDAVRLFFSYRYTPDAVRRWLERYGIAVLDQWPTPSNEEGVFLCRRS